MGFTFTASQVWALVLFVCQGTAGRTAGLTVTMDDWAVQDSASGHWRAQLICAPVRGVACLVRWTTPSGQRRRSDRSGKRSFHLWLGEEAEGGRYVCSVIARGANDGFCSAANRQASANVSQDDVRLVLLQAQQRAAAAALVERTGHVASPPPSFSERKVDVNRSQGPSTTASILRQNGDAPKMSLNTKAKVKPHDGRGGEAGIKSRIKKRSKRQTLSQTHQLDKDIQQLRADMTAQIRETNRNLSQLNNRVNTHDQEITRLNGSLGTLSRNVTRLESNVHVIENDAEINNSTLIIAVARLDWSLSALQLTVNKLNGTLVQDVTRLNGSLGTLTGNVSRLENNVTHLHSTVNRMNSSIEEHRQNITALSNRTRTMDNLLQSRNDSIKNLDSRVNILNDSFVQLSGTVRANAVHPNLTRELKDRVDTLNSSTLNSLKAIELNVKNLNGTLIRNVTNLDGSVSTLMGNVSRLERDVTQHGATVIRLNSSLEVQRQSVARISNSTLTAHDWLTLHDMAINIVDNSVRRLNQNVTELWRRGGAADLRTTSLDDNVTRRLDSLNASTSKSLHDIASFLQQLNRTSNKKVYFHADGLRSDAPGVYQPLIFGRVSPSQGSGYNVLTGIFTVSEPGYYFFVAKSASLSEGSYEFHYLKVNDNEADMAYTFMTQGYQPQAALFGVHKLKVGDRVWVSSGGHPARYNPAFSSFWGILLAPD